MKIAGNRKILLVAPQPFYEDRGTPIAIRHVLDALSAAGHRVDLLTFAVGRDISLPGLRIFRVGRLFGFKHIPIGFSIRKLLLDILLVFALLRMLRSQDYWCVHAVEEAVFPALMLGPGLDVPVIYDMQSCIPDQLRGHPFFGLSIIQRLLLAWERWALRRSALRPPAILLARLAHSAGIAEGGLHRLRKPEERELEHRPRWE